MTIFNYYIVFIVTLHYTQTGQSKVLCSTNSTRIPERHPRILQGDDVVSGEIRYIVVTFHDDEHYNCGGGIIDDYHVLSAAHCFINSQNKFGDKKIKVVAGIIDFVEIHYNDDDVPGRVEADVEKIYIPRIYKDSALSNDIAVLKLKTSLDIEKNNLTKLLLPCKPARNLTNQLALMVGYGCGKQNFFSNTFYSGGRLRKADILLYDNAKCQELYEKDTILESYLCGKMVKNSTWRKYGVCNGDSGGPLVMAQGQQKVVVGVASWSHGCDERMVPMVYTRVNKFLTFIKDAMKGKAQNMRIKTFTS